MYRSVRRLQRSFPIDDILFPSGDIWMNEWMNLRTSCKVVPNSAKIAIFLGRQFFEGRSTPNFQCNFINYIYRRTRSKVWWRLAERPQRLGKEKKGLNTRRISQWPSTSRMTGGHNKTGKADHIAKKFAATIPDIIGNLCSKFSDNWFIFKEVTTKKIDGPKFADPRLTAVSL